MKKIILISFIFLMTFFVLVGCGQKIESQFPLPETVENFTEQSEGDQINFQTDISSGEVYSFYQKSFGEQGLTERDELTVNDGSALSVVFDGHEKGSVVVQAVSLPDDKTNVNVRFESL